MTVATLLNRVSYSGNGVTTVFSFPNRFLADADLVVTQTVNATGVTTTKVLTTDYTLTGAGGAAGGNVTMLVAPPTGTTLVVYRDPVLTQPIDLVNGDPLNVDTGVERAFDRSTLQIQRLRDLADRSLRLNDSDTSGASTELPIPAPTRILGWNSAGTAIENKVPADLALYPVTVFAATVLDDADAATMVETLRNSLTVETVTADNDEIILRDTSGATGKRMTFSDFIGRILTVARTFTAAHVHQGAETFSAMAALTLAPGATGNVWSTGDAKLTYKNTADTGWVLMNDGSIGSAASGATTRANADTEALYTLLWTNITNTWAAVSSGRGASAAADFAANKTLTLPRTLGRALAVAGAGASLTSRALGEYLGAETHTLTTPEMPSHSHTINSGTGTGGAVSAAAEVLGTNSTNSTGGGGAHNNMPPETFINIMVKL